MANNSKELARQVVQVVDGFNPASEQSAAELAEHAGLAIELAAQCAGRPEAIEELVTATDYRFEEWALNLPMDLARAGLVEKALEVADALTEADTGYACDYACAAARILAMAGRDEDARHRIDQNLHRFGDIPYTWMASGEVLADLGDIAGAVEAYDRAVACAEERDDPSEVSDAREHLELFLTEHPEAQTKTRGPRTTVRVTQGPEGQVVVQAKTRVWVEREEIPRNAPCPCGSGRKYKRCCGSPR